MAKKEDSNETEPLTEEQRITALENRVGTNKIVLFGMALFLIIAVSASSTFFIVSLFGEEETGTEIESETVIALQAKVLELETKIETIQKTAKTTRSELTIVKDKVANSSNIRLQQIILEQEQGNQVFLDTLRSGMYDLAHMLPGSRTWLEVYGEKVDKAERYSKEREKALLDLKNGKVSEIQAQEDPFAEVF